MKKKLIVALATTLIIGNGASAALADSSSGTNNSLMHASEEGKRDYFGLTDAQKTALKAAIENNKGARELIMKNFKTAMDNARDAFKTAKEAATTEDARKAAEVAFKSVVATATQIKNDALKALTPVEKPTLTAEQSAALAKYRQDMETFRAAFVVYKGQRDAVRETFKSARETAREAYKTARELATTDEARKAIRDAFATARETARNAFETALTALGDAPVKPEKL